MTQQCELIQGKLGHRVERSDAFVNQAIVLSRFARTHTVYLSCRTCGKEVVCHVLGQKEKEKWGWVGFIAITAGALGFVAAIPAILAARAMGDAAPWLVRAGGPIGFGVFFLSVFVRGVAQHLLDNYGVRTSHPDHAVFVEKIVNEAD
jgi:hypothetical protein